MRSIKFGKNQRFSENSTGKRMYLFLMNCAAPVLTGMLAAGTACWAEDIRYESVFEYDKNPRQISETAELMTESYIETSLPVGEMTVMTENSGAELVEACGVYINDEFVGAVVDGDYLENELDAVIGEYLSDENIVEADYAVDTDLKQGVYRAAALVDEEEMTEFLTGEKEVVSEYEVEEVSAEEIAEEFSMSVDEVKELNPDIENAPLKDSENEKGNDNEVSDPVKVKVKEKVSVLPVRYVCEETEEKSVPTGGYFMETGSVKKVSRYSVTYVDGNEVSRILKNTETFDNEDDVEEELFSESVPDTDDLSGVQPEFIWPVDGGSISDRYISDRNHKGLDIAAPCGTDIYASSDGVVVEAGWNDGGYGYYVMIDHGSGYVTLYGHANEVYVSSGDYVRSGDAIAAVGSTGDSTGDHCHFEVRENGEFRNPEDFVSQTDSED